MQYFYFVLIAMSLFCLIHTNDTTSTTGFYSTTEKPKNKEGISFIQFGEDMGKEMQNDFSNITVDGSVKGVGKRSTRLKHDLAINTRQHINRIELKFKLSKMMKKVILIMTLVVTVLSVEEKKEIREEEKDAISFIKFGDDMGKEMKNKFQEIAIDGNLTSAKKRSADGPRNPRQDDPAHMNIPPVEDGEE